jgi:hypothetical protein
MSAEFKSAAPAEEAQPGGAPAGDRGSLGTLTWPRAAKVAGIAGAVAALTALSIAAGQLARVVGPPAHAHYTSVITPQRAPAP